MALLVAAGTTSASAAPVVGADISFPQCRRTLPATGAFGIVGVNNGRPYTANPCLVEEYRWALSSGIVEFYLNTANPGVALGDAYGYGFDAARDAYSTATSHVSAGPGHQWWLDVETANSWSPDKGANTAVIAGTIAFLRGRGLAVGIYSTRYQWGVITGGASIPGVPNWVPGAQSAAAAPSFCAASRSFSGGPVVMAQYTTQFDYDYLCPGASLPGRERVTPPAPPNLLVAILAWLRTL
jgi:hypothetical protein